MLDAGELPNLAKLMQRGAFGDCLSTVPSHSWCAWPSFMTGLNPAAHGVFDILEYKPGASRRLPVTYKSIKARSTFDDLSAAGKTSIAANIPLTFPPPDTSGKVVAGGVLPVGRPYTSPRSLEGELEAHAPFPINGMSWTTYRNRPEEFLEECARVTAARQRSFEYLLDTTSWDVAVLVFVSTDRIQHCLMEYLTPEHPRYEELKNTPVAKQTRAIYQQLDEGLGRLLERTTENDLVMLMSDHGHQPCTRACTMDRILADLGFLSFGRGSMAYNLVRWGPGRRVARRLYDLFRMHGRVSIPTSPIDRSSSRAYTSVVSTGEGVSVNLKGREPDGIVEPSDYEKVRDELADALANYTDPETGRNPIGRVYRKEEVLSGEFLDIAPDLLLVPAPLYSLTHARSAVEEADWLSGDHRLEGIVVAAGPEVSPGELQERVRLIDLMPTALAALGVSSSVVRDGQPVTGFVGAEAKLEVTTADRLGGTPEQKGDRLGSSEQEDPASSGDDTGLTSQEEDEIEDHLRGLGYVE
jgi:predicted AlkP superfamily phosphohydrolase/phosphomutase